MLYIQYAPASSVEQENICSTTVPQNAQHGRLAVCDYTVQSLFPLCLMDVVAVVTGVAAEVRPLP